MSTLPGLAARIRKALRSVAGAFDLPSIIVGVVVVGILAAGVLASVFGVIPFAQDNAAKQDLDSVRTAEGVAKTRLDGFKDKAGLLTGGLISDHQSYGVGSDAKGSCYVGISKSATGNVYFNSDRTTEPAPLTAGQDTGCIDGATRDSIVAAIGGYPAGPSASGAVPTAGSTTGALVGTSTGSGTSGSGGVTLAADTWSAKRTLINRYPDPGFKNGISGWTGARIQADYTDDAVTTVSYAATGYNGDAGSLKISATGSAGHDRATAYFPINVSNIRDFSYHIMTPDGTWDPNASWYGGVMFTDPATGKVIGSGSAENPTRAGGLGANVWESANYFNNFSASSTPAQAYLIIQADHIPAGRTITMYVDRILATAQEDCDWACNPPESPSVPGYEPNFDGSYPNSADWTYSWTGAVNASPSKAVAPKTIGAPSKATVGDTIQIKGAGYAPNSTATPAIFKGGAYGWYSDDFAGTPVQTDATGSFTTTMLIPATTQPWNWHVGVAEDTSFPATVPLEIDVKPYTLTAPGPWSAAVADSTEQFSAPSSITIGQDFTVVGKGFAPFRPVYLYTDGWGTEVDTVTDNFGNFSTTMNIPSSDPAGVSGPGTIYAEGDGATDPSLSLTFK